MVDIELPSTYMDVMHVTVLAFPVYRILSTIRRAKFRGLIAT